LAAIGWPTIALRRLDILNNRIGWITHPSAFKTRLRIVVAKGLFNRLVIMVEVGMEAQIEIRVNRDGIP
jgi:hypothetical protein